MELNQNIETFNKNLTRIFTEIENFINMVNYYILRIQKIKKQIYL